MDIHGLRVGDSHAALSRLARCRARAAGGANRARRRAGRVLVAGERRIPLSSFEFADGTVAPEGWRALESFALDGSLPVWHFADGEVLVERRAWMVHGANTTVVRYRLLRGPAVRIEVTPLVTCRDHHVLRTGHGAVTHTVSDGGRPSASISTGQTWRST